MDRYTRYFLIFHDNIKIKKGNYIPVVPDYLSNAKISFSKNQKYSQKKNQVFLDFFRIIYYL